MQRETVATERPFFTRIFLNSEISLEPAFEMLIFLHAKKLQKLPKSRLYALSVLVDALPFWLKYEK